MEMETALKTCRACGGVTEHIRPKTNHGMHLLFTILTGGLWGIGWLFAYLTNKGTASCQVCQSRLAAEAQARSQASLETIQKRQEELAAQVK